MGNFAERRFAYEHAVSQLAGSEKCGIIHELAVAPDDAYANMLGIIDAGEPLAQSYAAVFDDIAIGAMKALMERGYRVPDDVRIIGFDNHVGGTYVQPQLTTLNVPSQYMGIIAARRLVEIIDEAEHHPLKIELGPSLIKRRSA